MSAELWAALGIGATVLFGLIGVFVAKTVKNRRSSNTAIVFSDCEPPLRPARHLPSWETLTALRARWRSQKPLETRNRLLPCRLRSASRRFQLINCCR
jgi:hypothetical protein